jgi:hypothetical protein
MDTRDGRIYSAELVEKMAEPKCLLGMIRELDRACKPRNLCWSIGRTRIAQNECRVWPRDQTKTKPVIIEDGPSFEASVHKALTRVCRLPGPGTDT